ncbi:DUF494 family protein [Pseudomarimonas arenosa]|uniref:Protein Smg homolog n=1 Tax=Pseudomarimonas arenosa TaxID=2774145 RepID=A0AAW3ZIG4_9GAMM|nr:DUF494 domain-containing protein [Pseudomarimonas arenosa]MBD8525215.1 DUF494 domain-containing protein [Pseudomarimonas arenosa]
MKENVLDVLLYLFEHYFYEDPDGVSDRESLRGGLLEAGFSGDEIGKAFEWLEALARARRADFTATAHGPTRVFAAAEQARLGTEGLGFLIFLEQIGVLDPSQRELAVDRAMALDDDTIDLDDLKWVILMVLFNQPGQEAAFAWMESHLFDREGGLLH